MSTITTPDESSRVRSRIVCNGVIAIAVAAMLAIGSEKAQFSRGRALQTTVGTSTPSGPLKQIDAAS